MAAFFGSCLLFGWKVTQWRPLVAVLAVAVAGEAWDLYDALAAGKPLTFASNLKDILNGLLLPAVIMLLARYSGIFRRA